VTVCGVDGAQRLGWVVSSARRQRGWTLDHAAQLAGLDKKTVLRIEAGNAVQARSWRQLAVALGLGDGDLLTALHRADGVEWLAERLGVRAPVESVPPPDAEALADLLVAAAERLRGRH